MKEGCGCHLPLPRHFPACISLSGGGTGAHFWVLQSAKMGMKTLTKLSQPACRHPWPPPSITLHPAPVGNPSLAGALSAHSILLMPCRHTAKSPFLPPQPPACPQIQQKSHFQVKKKSFPRKHSHRPSLVYVQRGILGATELLRVLNISSKAKMLCVWRMSRQMEMHP